MSPPQPKIDTIQPLWRKFANPSSIPSLPYLKNNLVRKVHKACERMFHTTERLQPWEIIIIIIL